MIGRVRGILTSAAPGGVEVLTPAGVGYEIAIPSVMLDRLPSVGAEIDLYTSLVVRDDALQLYGFESARDRELFRRLQAASGVGPKLALSLLSELPGGRIVTAIRAKDHAVLQSVSGVGRKTAERIGLELADKLEDMAGDEAGAEPSVSTAAVRALRSLGYGASESRDAVARAASSLDGREVPTEELIRIALQQI